MAHSSFGFPVSELSLHLLFLFFFSFLFFFFSLFFFFFRCLAICVCVCACISSLCRFFSLLSPHIGLLACLPAGQASTQGWTFSFWNTPDNHDTSKRTHFVSFHFPFSFFYAGRGCGLGFGVWGFVIFFSFVLGRAGFLNLR